MPKKTLTKTVPENNNELKFTLTEELNQKFISKLSEYKHVHEHTSNKLNEFISKYEPIYVLFETERRQKLFGKIHTLKSFIRCYEDKMKKIELTINQSFVNETQLCCLDSKLDCSNKSCDEYIEEMVKICCE
jgi:hypothetical protein